MTKYIAIIDYKASIRTGLDHITLTAKNLLDAMTEAEKLMDDTVYLVEIAEKISKTQKVSDYKETLFKEVLTNRGNGWHRCDSDHCESVTTWKMIQAKWGECFEIAHI